MNNDDNWSVSNHLPPCRLFPIFARSAPRAVIFRRGPTNWYQLILWHTDTDRFEFGQWFKGRIHVRRSDLSPDGGKLIYFAHKITARTIQDKEYTYAWTAVSKPPYLTALALWPKGDSWHGGGLFDDDETLFLNHKPDQAQPHPNHLPQGLDVRPNPDARGERDPIFGMRLERDGWQLQQEWKLTFQKGAMYVTEAPEIRSLAHPQKNYSIQLTRRLDCLTYRELFAVMDQNGDGLADCRDADWVDWDQNGRLVLLRDGKLFVGLENDNGHFSIQRLADFNPYRPEPVVSPPWARRW
jgi:hypothetical protein